MHGHLGRCRFAIPEVSTASIVALMDRIGVESIVCSHMQTMSTDCPWGNRQIRQAMREYAGRVLGYVSLWPGSSKEMQVELQRCLDDGFVGLKLHNIHGLAYTDERYGAVMAMANERRLPVLLHTWGTNEVFDQIRHLAGQYREAAFLLGHAGCQAEDEYVKTARQFENVYLDTALSYTPRGLVERLVTGAGAEKVVWGSDAYFFNMAQQIGRVLGAQISDDEKMQVLGRNARGLLDRVRR